MSKQWQVGDRVVRLVYLDDGTWAREGDSCLPHSPKYHGVVVKRLKPQDNEVCVVFDGTTKAKRFFDVGLQEE